MGISLNTTNQTLTQTEELLKTFSGQGVLSFPQWQYESFAVLQSSGVSKALWHNLLLKKIAAPAITKISQSSISSKEVDKILDDLKRHYNKSLVIAAAISSVHISAGKIPDHEFDIAKSLPILQPIMKLWWLRNNSSNIQTYQIKKTPYSSQTR